MATIPADHVKAVCRLGEGKATCAFLTIGMGGAECAKGDVFESAVRARLKTGSMGAQGDNCSGPPDFTPTQS